MLRKISETAYVAPAEIAVIDAYDSGEPPRPDLQRETGTLVTLKSGKHLTLRGVTPKEVVDAIGGDEGVANAVLEGQIAVVEAKFAALKALALDTSERVDRIEGLESPGGVLTAE